MRFFRSTWLQRTLLVLFLVSINAGSFGFIGQLCDSKDDLSIHAERFPAELKSLCQQNKFKCGFDVIPVSIETVFKKTISDDFIPGISYDPFRVNLRSFSSRGPPRLIAVL